MPELHQETDRIEKACGLKRIISQDCAWNAVTLPPPVNHESLAIFASQLQAAGAYISCFLMNKGVLMVSWRKPDNAG